MPYPGGYSAVGNPDILIGEIGEVTFSIGASLSKAWNHTVFTASAAAMLRNPARARLTSSSSACAEQTA